jgi:hypothetical protein
MPAPVWAQVENVPVLEEAAIGTLRAHREFAERETIS